MDATTYLNLQVNLVNPKAYCQRRCVPSHCVSIARDKKLFPHKSIYMWSEVLLTSEVCLASKCLLFFCACCSFSIKCLFFSLLLLSGSKAGWILFWVLSHHSLVVPFVEGGASLWSLIRTNRDCEAKLSDLSCIMWTLAVLRHQSLVPAWVPAWVCLWCVNVSREVNTMLSYNQCQSYRGCWIYGTRKILFLWLGRAARWYYGGHKPNNYAVTVVIEGSRETSCYSGD